MVSIFIKLVALINPYFISYKCNYHTHIMVYKRTYKCFAFYSNKI